MKLLNYALVCASFAFLSGESNAQSKKTLPVVHEVNNVSHYYDFHLDWGFPRRQMKSTTARYGHSWRVSHDSD